MDHKKEEDWKADLTPEQYAILREKGTEAPFSGMYVNTKEDGMYHCAGCDAPLFPSDTKFDSGTGWPSFTHPVVAEAVEMRADTSHGMERTEVVCKTCGGHLGHVFNDGPSSQPGEEGKRYCINSTALNFKKKE